ncbi:TetR/AcrR family transcriptional regulator, partial [Streptomyces sp. TRM76130]|nr:TetR/AcrR family transcriptional regulator [Streptomyces sp. TRM76130]
LDLQLAAEPGPGRRYTVPARRFHCAHVTLLLRQVIPDADGELLAHTLMSSLDPVLVHHLTVQRGMPLDRLERAWVDLVARTTGTPPPR